MRFTKVKPIAVKIGDRRTIKKFAWLPTITGMKNDLIEVRVWLEFYMSEEKYDWSEHTGGRAWISTGTYAISVDHLNTTSKK